LAAVDTPEPLETAEVIIEVREVGLTDKLVIS